MSFGNVVDAASSIKDGEFGLVEEVLIGDLVVSALTGLDAPEILIITSKPVDAGITFTDAAVEGEFFITMDIVLANPDFSVESGVTAALTGNVSAMTETWRDKRDKLKKYKTDREIIEVVTQDEKYDSILVQSISPRYDVENNLDCWRGTVVLKKIIQRNAELSSGGIFDAAMSAVSGL